MVVLTGHASTEENNSEDLGPRRAQGPKKILEGVFRGARVYTMPEGKAKPLMAACGACS